MSVSATLFADLYLPQRTVAREGSLRTTIALDPKFELPAVTPVFDEFWRFAALRQEVFFRRVSGQRPPWTENSILQRYKFTNVYRASDRVSQFLIRNVIYNGPQEPPALFFRILLFKLFNRIDTWKLLERHLGDIHPDGYTFERYDAILSDAMSRGERIYSAAYIMPVPAFGEQRKHQNHLRLLEAMMGDRLPVSITKHQSMGDVYASLCRYPGIGAFLAYQYTIDLNYSILMDFDEDDFVVAGPGALDGLRKCFEPSDVPPDELIRRVAKHQDLHFERLGISFRDLWGRRLKLIDCQNLFCEISKYARVAFPDIAGTTKRDRIKQYFQPTASTLRYMYPPKWKLSVD